jgi:5-methyltetrahydrofolate--homocysteine methyltransferase
MLPASSVSGWYFAHPDAKYFGLGKITKEQVENVAHRKSTDFEVISKWYNSIVSDY